MTSHSEIAHIWAQQQKTSRKGKNVFFEGRTIYSYGYHWPLGTFIPESCKRTRRLVGEVVICNESHSVSTNGHASIVRRAVNHKRFTQYGSNRLIYKLSMCDNDDEMLQSIMHYHKDAYQSTLFRLDSIPDKRRAYAQTTSLANEVQRHIESYNAALALMTPQEKQGNRKIRIPAYFADIFEYASRREQSRLIKRQEQERIAEEKRLARLAHLKPYESQALKAWRNNESPKDLNVKEAIQEFIKAWSATTRVRLIENSTEIETSKGAIVPLDHGLAMIRAIRAMPSGKPSRAIRVGYYTVDFIDHESGVVTIGCHKLTLDEIDAALKFYNIKGV